MAAYESIHISAPTRRAILAAARAARPHEMIGVLGGPDRHRPGDAGQQLVRHFAPLPNASPGPDRFEVDPIAFAVAEAQLRRAGLTFLGFAHSHLDGITEPSDLDRRQLWPHCLQVIVAITTTDAATFRAFRRRANRVLEVAIADPSDSPGV
ncbi:MAG: Mov34/MPN/PAD-1 family protein [Planctomycetes bacterium]|nr:Mov34/MPN/PAD-1 family protein [Planctomycetota bacterium]